MLALEAPIKARLQALPQLTGWAVRTGTDAADRAVVPAVHVRCAGAGVADRKAGAVLVAPEWQITLAVRRGPAAAEQLDSALSAVIESLHGWQPGQHGGRGWEPLTLARVTEPMLADEGVAGYQLDFSTGARYMGQQ